MFRASNNFSYSQTNVSNSDDIDDATIDAIREVYNNPHKNNPYKSSIINNTDSTKSVSNIKKYNNRGASIDFSKDGIKEAHKGLSNIDGSNKNFRREPSTIEAKVRVNSNNYRSRIDVIQKPICRECEGTQHTDTTTNDIRDTTNDIRDTTKDSTQDNDRKCRYDPGATAFSSLIVPVTNLTSSSDNINSVEFRMRRKNKMVVLQWEPFSGIMAANGVTSLTVTQSVWNLPPYPITYPIYIRYKNTNKITHMKIDPNPNNGNIKFYLNEDRTGSNVNVGDEFEIYGGCINWIVD